MLLVFKTWLYVMLYLCTIGLANNEDLPFSVILLENISEYVVDLLTVQWIILIATSLGWRFAWLSQYYLDIRIGLCSRKS